MLASCGVEPRIDPEEMIGLEEYLAIASNDELSIEQRASLERAKQEVFVDRWLPSGEYVAVREARSSPVSVRSMLDVRLAAHTVEESLPSILKGISDQLRESSVIMEELGRAQGDYSLTLYSLQLQGGGEVGSLILIVGESFIYTVSVSGLLAIQDVETAENFVRTSREGVRAFAQSVVR